MNIIFLKEAAAYLGYCTKHLQKLDRIGVFKARRTETNRRYYTKEDLEGFLHRYVKTDQKKISIAYCRVSSRNQLPELKNQRAAIEEFCIAKGIPNVDYVEEVGGGLNFKRPEFLKIIDLIISDKIDTLVIAHKDRLVRFGFELIEYLCNKHNVNMLIINAEKLSPEAEMAQDLMTIVHCFSSRLYGLRNYKKSLIQALK
jgi:predicted site-specific integrase-resolvase